MNPSTCIIWKSLLNYARMRESNSPSLIPLELLSTCSGKKLLNGDKRRSLKIGKSLGVIPYFHWETDTRVNEKRVLGLKSSRRPCLTRACVKSRALLFQRWIRRFSWFSVYSYLPFIQWLIYFIDSRKDWLAKKPVSTSPICPSRSSKSQSRMMTMEAQGGLSLKTELGTPRGVWKV